MSKTGTTASFVYNAEGLRVRKTVNSVVTNYTLHGKNIVHMTQGSNTLHFWYDAQNRPAIVQFNGTKYAYIHNLQGDIVGLIDTSGTEVVKYMYDPWGKILSASGSLASTLGAIQPFRYRGYVYDTETELYYLRSRYYNTDFNRFVNADTVIGSNAFSYCENTPACMLDSEGYSPSNAMRVLIHNAVCWHICESFPDIMICRYGMKVKFESPVDGKTYGFIDILDLYQGEVYEVKRVGIPHDNAVVQLSHYIGGTLIGLQKLLGEDAVIPDYRLRPGTNTSIKGEFTYLNYSVSYWFAKDGIIEYDYNELSMQPDSLTVPVRKKQKQHNSAESINWGKVIGTACVVLAVGGPVLAMLARLNDVPNMN